MTDGPFWKPPSDAPGALEPTKQCPRCAEDVKSAAEVCRFCGHGFSAFPAQPGTFAPTVSEESGKAIAAFVCSLLGFWFVSLPLAYSARNDMRRSGRESSNGWLITASLIISWIEAALTALLVIFIILAVASFWDAENF